MKDNRMDWHEEIIITNGSEWIPARRLGRDARQKLLNRPGWYITHTTVDVRGVSLEKGSIPAAWDEQSKDIGGIDAV